MVNCIWFTDEKMFTVSALSNMVAWNQASRDPKTQPFCKQYVLVHCLAGRCKSQAIPQVRESDRFGHFRVCNGKTLTVCHQWARWSSQSKQGRTGIQQHYCQQRLQQASLYSRHIMTSALHHN